MRLISVWKNSNLKNFWGLGARKPFLCTTEEPMNTVQLQIFDNFFHVCTIKRHSHNVFGNIFEAEWWNYCQASKPARLATCGSSHHWLAMRWPQSNRLTWICALNDAHHPRVIRVSAAVQYSHTKRDAPKNRQKKSNLQDLQIAFRLLILRQYISARNALMCKALRAFVFFLQALDFRPAGIG